MLTLFWLLFLRTTFVLVFIATHSVTLSKWMLILEMDQDFSSWKTKPNGSKFSFMTHPYILNPATKAQALFYDNRWAEALGLIMIMVSEPGASYKNRRLRNQETPCRYIIARVNESIYFLITLGTLLKSLFTNQMVWLYHNFTFLVFQNISLWLIL